MQKSMSKSAMQSGLIMGALFSLNFIFSVSGVYALSVLTNVLAIAILVVMYLLIVRFRDKDCDGEISYGKALGYIIGTFFYAAIISTVVKYIYFQFINTAYLETLFQASLKMMEQMKFPITDATVEQTESFYKPVPFSLLYIFTNAFMGTITGLIMAAFVKKEKSLFDENK